ncbi:bifunctional hydroxymethylpyrimidine kinase/phosphomethylpyrimidine kinase [Sporosarcina sp. P21c]|uniref:bifunctional hydroxymethylpyrimidine kinase/phosphomethylpyrimidine kinase n=1 Tax=unclassified Sporosarcina TaxID=2647733 RepID=UPI000C16302F|nr:MULTISPECIES: bifunctional hydroxymethylpyrimidine kinase/phosphomethylpyrimidine kinase [unclassified Sporosarcina]PIC66695.1 bifunctional hydroxymethylpyrimidine kinase/phosphomethylpyrimidine kinase [Sporosarcina sp. P16a]PIC89830.1 bifunctional hydroxymethylpyrimidine kinase/phosphomethylpyrimidine kinase [Sporosarcina sp. P21c]PIC93216.1 bifunctional hydroxymethylpyrimidine kinase/phosphomethylpyrimidine kinase [Sporosarcina sp. P25]
MIKRALTIAGSAARGGAGIQADLKTFQEFDVFGTTAVTAIVARNPRTGQSIFPQSWEAIEAQLVTIEEDIGIDAMKTGMLFTKEIILNVTKWIQQSDIQHIVVDPVMIGKMGSALLKDDAMKAMQNQLIPLATIITPNMPEASYLLGGMELTSVVDLKEAARRLFEFGPKFVLVKGGRLDGPAVDVLYDGEQFYLLEAPRIDTLNTNGAGCSYSAAIVAGLAKGQTVQAAVIEAKKFITAGIRHSLTFKQGVGSTYHAAYGKYDEMSCTVTIERACVQE